MNHHDMHQPDYGTGQKKLGIYLIGIISCAILTLIAFWAVGVGTFSKLQVFVIIYTAACIQFLVQLICFLRLNVQTEQGKSNVMSLVFTGVILVSIILGSLWIMWNLNYYMMH
jgi:cytochrome o ubiquinol oxidase operon protein cyoD